MSDAGNAASKIGLTLWGFLFRAVSVIGAIVGAHAGVTGVERQHSGAVPLLSSVVALLFGGFFGWWLAIGLLALIVAPIQWIAGSVADGIRGRSPLPFVRRIGAGLGEVFSGVLIVLAATAAMVGIAAALIVGPFIAMWKAVSRRANRRPR